MTWYKQWEQQQPQKPMYDRVAVAPRGASAWARMPGIGFQNRDINGSRTRVIEAPPIDQFKDMQITRYGTPKQQQQYAFERNKRGMDWLNAQSLRYTGNPIKGY